MMSILITHLKEKMTQEGMTAYSLERRAGLKSTAVHNILSGRSKNPSIHIMQSIAKALNCSVSDLIGEDSSLPNELPKLNTPPKIESNQIANHELYVKCLSYLCSLLDKKKLWLKKEQIINYVDEIYFYSNKKNLKKPDTHFSDWLIEKAST